MKSHQDLVTRARIGEQAAFDELFAPHAESLRLFASHKLGRPLRSGAESAEFLQDIFMAAFSNVQDFQGESAEDLRRWMQRIAEKRVVEGKAGNAPHGPRFRLGPMTMAAVQQERGRLEHAWDKLPEKFRRVIGFRQLEGLTAASTAARMQIAEKEVNALYLEAVKLWKDLAAG